MGYICYNMVKSKLNRPTPDKVLRRVLQKDWSINMASKYVSFAIMENYEGDWQEAKDILDAAERKRNMPKV